MALLIIAISCGIQVLAYRLCAKFKAVRWLDLLLFPLFFIGTVWGLPALFMSTPDSQGNCGYSDYGMTLMLFVFGGGGSCVILFLLNCYFRKGENTEKR